MADILLIGAKRISDTVALLESSESTPGVALISEAGSSPYLTFVVTKVGGFAVAA
ncbi:hypothetical protein AB5N19_09776 [Seiridium cardinale]